MMHWLYLALLLVWVLVLGFQWLIGWRKLWQERKNWPWVVLGASIYLSLADAVALEQHLWFFRPTFLTGWSVGKVPVEEILFFVLMTAMITQGFVLLFPAEMSARNQQPGLGEKGRDEDRVKERSRKNVSGRKG